MAYQDENYKQNENVYDSIVQVFEDLKYEKCASIGNTWNVPVEALKGVTLKLVGKDHILVSYHSFMMSTPEILPHKKAECKKFLDEVAKELKKRFKSKTKKVLTLKKVSENDGIEKYSQMYAETSKSSLGSGPRAVMSAAGKYLVRVGRLYHFDTALKDDAE